MENSPGQILANGLFRKLKAYRKGAVKIDNNKNMKTTWNKAHRKRFENQLRKEVKMSAKGLLRIVILVGLIMAVILVAPGLASKSAPSTVSVNSVANERLDKYDNIYLNPPVPHPANYYVGSDWIERHPVATPSDNYYTGSDWIERHPCQPTR